MIPVMEPTPRALLSEAERVLLELAAEVGMTDVRHPSTIRARLISHRCERESMLRQLENKNHILETIALPGSKARLDTMKGERDALAIDVDEWATRAKRAEKALWLTLCIVVAGGVALVAAIATLGSGITC